MASIYDLGTKTRFDAIDKIYDEDVIIFSEGDALSYHNNQQFTTKDRDNDKRSRENCAITFHGAWWYKSCLRSNLNGKYFREGKLYCKAVNWYYWKSNYSAKGVKMKIRPILIN